MKPIQPWHVILLCIFSWGGGFLISYLQKDKIPIQQDKMTVDEATFVVAAHDACIKNVATGFCYMTFENFIYYYEAIAVVKKDKQHEIE
jgi:hypothetical protein